MGGGGGDSGDIIPGEEGAADSVFNEDTGVLGKVHLLLKPVHHIIHCPVVD